MTMRILDSQNRLLVYIVVGCIACAFASRAAIASETHAMDHVISVTGSAAASVEPDLVSVRFGVETQQESSRAALAANAELMQAVTDSLQDAGVDRDEISTSQFNIHAVYESQQDRQTGRHSQILTGYRVSNILKVETGNLDLVAIIIDSAVAAGVNRVDGIQFMLSPAVLAGLKDSLIETAVLNARSKAEKALAPLDHVITGVKSITMSEHFPSPQMMDAPRLEMARSASTQVFASDQDVRTTVQVTFLIGENPPCQPQD